jgi:hypothetical protein
VLGARRPGVGAWNFVVAALVAVDLLPLAQGLLTRAPLERSLLLLSVAGTIAVGVLNYLPTRLAPAGLLLAVACGIQFAGLLGQPVPEGPIAIPRTAEWLALAFVPWLAHVCLAGRPPAPSAFDELWLDYRDRFGFFWSQRLREQFNRSAAHAGWQVILRWNGLRLVRGTPLPEPDVQEAMLATLRALMKRFVDDDPKGRTAPEDGRAGTAS